jgi:hypothetical protein
MAEEIFWEVNGAEWEWGISPGRKKRHGRFIAVEREDLYCVLHYCSRSAVFACAIKNRGENDDNHDMHTVCAEACEL